MSGAIQQAATPLAPVELSTLRLMLGLPQAVGDTIKAAQESVVDGVILKGGDPRQLFEDGICHRSLEGLYRRQIFFAKSGVVSQGNAPASTSEG